MLRSLGSQNAVSMFRRSHPAGFPLTEQVIAVSCHPSVYGIAKKRGHEAQGTEKSPLGGPSLHRCSARRLYLAHSVAFDDEHTARVLRSHQLIEVIENSFRFLLDCAPDICGIGMLRRANPLYASGRSSLRPRSTASRSTPICERGGVPAAAVASTPVAFSDQ